MGHRTLSLNLVFRALFLDGDAYDALRDDDNPFVEGLFLIVIIGVATALLNLIGQLLAWASSPSMDAIKEIILRAYQQMPWWAFISGNPQAMSQFQQFWDSAWRIFPALFGAPNPGGAALNILLWPLVALLSWLIYGLLAHLFAKLFRGVGNLNQTLGTTALAFTPLLLRGLGVIPFFAIGGAINTWQLICRYKALRSVHRLSWGQTFWVTVLPFVIYLLFWLLLGGLGAAIIAAAVRR
jgi:hypothetical protein